MSGANGPFTGRGPSSAVVAPGANRSGLVLFLGLGLVAANMLADPAVRTLFPLMAGAQNRVVAPQPGTANLIDIGVQVLLVLLLTGVAAVSEEAGSLAVALIIGLWLVFLVMRVDVVSGAIKWVQQHG